MLWLITRWSYSPQRLSNLSKLTKVLNSRAGFRFDILSLKLLLLTIFTLAGSLFAPLFQHIPCMPAQCDFSYFDGCPLVVSFLGLFSLSLLLMISVPFPCAGKFMPGRRGLALGSGPEGRTGQGSSDRWIWDWMNSVSNKWVQVVGKIPRA